MRGSMADLRNGSLTDASRGAKQRSQRCGRSSCMLLRIVGWRWSVDGVKVSTRA